ncbi:hypothetical protein Agub_g6948 [Astrephomene gubernaculifera]|uniref:Granulins domain-containing protein n=1 Tax=Astrephomene gubernaculifera TaxID=47775 RepID=A0AAD3DPA8_9CHLO|nr:hypothetical protein Agub_g6948 [Astrephomene gubernaculifera]
MGLITIFLACALAPLAYAQSLSANDLLALAQAAPERAFPIWVEKHGRSYREGSTEYSRRLNVFKDNIKAIVEHQAKDPGVTLALNEYADLTWQEFSSTRLGLRIGQQELDRRASQSPGLRSSWRYAAAEAPRAMDWRDKGAVTQVKNQGQCGSCWAFSAVGAIEGVNALATGQLTQLSEQQLVDCDTDTNMGCSGGLMDDAFKYVLSNGGLDSEADYGYWSGYGMGFWCNKRKQADRHVVSIDGYEDVPQDETSLRRAVGHQPVAVAICAGAGMQFYSRGIISSCCEGLNHGVLVVGYNVSSSSSSDGAGSQQQVKEGGTAAAAAGAEADAGGDSFWIVKNSWGPSWGEEGYFRLKMGEGPMGLCGIASAASYPTKSHPNKPVPEICDPFGWTECPVGNSCSCSFNLLGLLCLWHDCCPLSGGVTCPDLKHCCPAGTTCDQRQGVCVSDDGTASTPWTDKTKAAVASAADSAGGSGAAAKDQLGKLANARKSGVAGAEKGLAVKSGGGKEGGAERHVIRPAQ